MTKPTKTEDHRKLDQQHGDRLAVIVGLAKDAALGGVRREQKERARTKPIWGMVRLRSPNVDDVGDLRIGGFFRRTMA